MSERITLRLKSNPSVVLPEASVEAGSDIHNWRLRFAADTRLVTIAEADWEPVPSPFELPTGLGAVVVVGDAKYVSVGYDWWVTHDGNDECRGSSIQEQAEAGRPVSVLSDGVPS